MIEEVTYRQQRHRAIFAVAMQLFRTQGFEATTTSEIARAARVSRSTFFNHFPYKEAILLEFGAQWISGLQRSILAGLERGEDPVSLLRRTFQGLATELSHHPDLVPPLVQELLHRDPLRARSARQALPLDQLFRRLLETLAGLGRLRAGWTPLALSQALSDSCLLTCLRWSLAGSAGSLEQELAGRLELLFYGMLERCSA